MSTLSIIVYLQIIFLTVCFAQHAEKCPKYGCPISPLDVNESVIRDALEVLRSESAPDSEKEQALKTLQSAGDEDKTTLTLKSYKGGRPERQINQDSAMIYSPYTIPGYTKRAQLLGIFDGHGRKGEVISNYAATVLPRLLSMKLSEIDLNDQEAVSQVLKTGFILIDKNDPTLGEAGCTATLILQLDEKLYIANAGDSLSFISGTVDGESFVIYESREDKPEVPEEKERIEAAGGYVLIPRDNSDVPRAYAVVDGRLGTGLAMSRCLGDWGNQGVIAEPLVDVLAISDIILDTLTNLHEKCRNESITSSGCDGLLNKTSSVQIMAVAASDGIIDYVRPPEISSMLAPSFFSKENEKHPHLAAEDLVIFSGNRWDTDYGGQYRDDITIAAVKVFLGDDEMHSTGEGAVDNGGEEL
jgi:serine/threonine protein phosphatase PrpC